MKELDLGKEKIGKLLVRFSVPCVISMLVAALYNIVDQIFIGWSPAGTAGNAATNIVYPFTVVALAFALLIGDGAASLFSLSLGAKDKEKADKSIGNGVTLLAILSILLMIIGLLFQNQILGIFGGNPKEVLCYQYAKDYLFIVCLGIPFYVIGQGLNGSIRADGSPKYAMIATIAGAICNIILDPVFIFVFGMEVKGAAIATIIGQILTFVISVLYFRKSKLFKITKGSLKLEKNINKRILSLGLASFITQISIVAIISVANNLIAKYGYMTVASTGKIFGAVEPLAVVGICMKVFGIVVSIVIGVALGGQPIVGYNMGAGNVQRVKETCKKIMFVNFIVGVIAFLLFELCPNYIISIFGKSTSVEYQEFAKLCLNIFLGGIVLTCLIKSTSIFLQSVGSSFKSTLLALSRDVIFFVPAIVIIAMVSQNIVTMLWSAVVADVLAFILAALLLCSELKKLESLSQEDEEKVIEEDNISINSVLKKKVVITISREYGSGGHFVGKMLSEKLGLKFYDKEIIDLTAKEYGYSKKYVEENEEKQILDGNIYYIQDDKLFAAESDIIRNLSKESCVIVGRCADYVLKDNSSVISVFLYSDDENKVKRAVKYYGLSKDSALKEINKINKERAKHYKFYTNREWKDFNNYDLCLNVDALGIDNTVKMIEKFIIEKNDVKKD